MKKAILLLCVSIISTLIINEASAQKIKLGVRAGYNSSKWRGETVKVISDMTTATDAITVKEKPGFYAGVFTSIPISNRIIFEPGLFYSQKGVNVSMAYPGENIFQVKGTLTDHAHYIDLPLQLKINLTDHFFVYGGPQVSYLVANEVEGRVGALGLSVGKKFEYDGVFNKLDIGVSGGVGINFTPKINFQVGYEYGLMKLDNTIDASIYNRAIKAGLGLTF